MSSSNFFMNFASMIVSLLHSTKIKIQWLLVIALAMTTVLLLLCHLLTFSQSTPEPDTHIHVYLPPEGGQGNFFLCFFLLMCFFEGEALNTGGRFVNNDLK